MNKQDKKVKGFTLIEMLISMTVFVMITIIALSIYSSILRANKKSVTVTRLQRDAQMITTALAKKIRQSQVDYTYYPSGVVPNDNTELALTDADGTHYVFSLDPIDDVVLVSVDGGDEVVIPAGNVAITDMRFFIEPVTDPFTVAPSVNPDFPRVTMVMRLEPRGQEGVYNDPLIVQQTVPQRGGGY